MAKKTYGEVLYRASSFLTERGKERNAAEFLMSGRLGWQKTKLVMQLREVMPQAEKEQFEKDIEQFAMGMPAQYILGFEYFYEEKFIVTKDTLIPRPETEELVELCLKHNKNRKDITVVDVGTGTGVIAITLKRLNPTWRVIAIDISKEALDVARENAKLHDVEIDFRLGNLLDPVREEEIALLISNPPYISMSEWEEMDESVRKHEPKQALFAEDNGLAYYERLAKELPRLLQVDASVYLEFGYKQARAVQQMFQHSFPTKKVLIQKDLSGHDRMLEMR